MGPNPVEYRANRWRAAVATCAIVVIAYYGLQLSTSPELASRQFEGEGFVLNFAPLAVRQGFLLVTSTLALVAMPLFGRFVLRPRAVTIGDDGVEMATFLGWRRALWADFKGMKRGAHGVATLSFHSGLGGKARTLILPARLIGIDHDVILADVNLRVEKWRQTRRDRPAGAKAVVRAMTNFRDAGGEAGRRRV